MPARIVLFNREGNHGKQTFDLYFFRLEPVYWPCALPRRRRRAEQVTRFRFAHFRVAGYQASTPCTAGWISPAINRDAAVDIGDSIRELPAVGAFRSYPNNAARNANSGPGDAVLDTVSLRSLGTARTLVLFDGQRVVTSNPSNGSAGGGGGAIGTGGGGGVDLSTLPTSLIERVDVVTGGASAAWGSDAVAGVVNLVLNKKFEGVKANAEFGDTDKDDHRVYKGELSVGTSFDGDRGHLILSVQHTMSPDAVFISQRDWWNPQGLFPAPPGASSCGGGTVASPEWIRTYLNGGTAHTIGGLISSSAAGVGTVGVNGRHCPAPANALKGLQFGPNGTISPRSRSARRMASTAPIAPRDQLQLQQSVLRGCGARSQYGLVRICELHADGRYQGVSSAQFWLQLRKNRQSPRDQCYGQARQRISRSDHRSADGGRRIPSLPPAGQRNVVDLTVADTIHPSFATLEQGFGEGVTQTQRQMLRGVFTLEGTLGPDWSWNAYAQNSEVRERMHMPNNLLTPNYNNAIDAVRVTAAGPDSVTPAAAAALLAAGAPVPQVGSIACSPQPRP